MMDFKIEKSLCVGSSRVREELWKMYDRIFGPVNLQTPCRQHCYREEFLEAMQDEDFQKFILRAGNRLGGIGLITNHLEKVPWVSVGYFHNKFPALMERRLLYYLVGIAVHPKLSAKGLGGKLLAEMICSLPTDGAVAFDYSEGVNRVIPIFAEKALPEAIEGKVLDSQIYCLYRWARKGDLNA